MANKSNPLNFSNSLGPHLGIVSIGEVEQCSICVQPAYTRCILPCGHNSICYVCMARLVLLMGSKDCPFCKSSFNEIRLSRRGPSHDRQELNGQIVKKWKSPSGVEFSTSDSHLPIDNVGHLLEHKCWFNECRKNTVSFPDNIQLNKHILETHGRKFCEVCISGRQECFMAEQFLYVPRDLNRHCREGEVRSEPRLEAHQNCKFCKEICFDSDALAKHQKLAHVVCPCCTDAFGTYDSYWKHALEEHYLCKEPECMELKFIVFKTKAQLLGHMQKKHDQQLAFGSVIFDNDHRPTRNNTSNNLNRANPNAVGDEEFDRMMAQGSVDVALAFAATAGANDEETHAKWQLQSSRRIHDVVAQHSTLSTAAAQQANKTFASSCMKFFSSSDFDAFRQECHKVCAANHPTPPETFASKVFSLFWDVASDRALQKGITPPNRNKQQQEQANAGLGKNDTELDSELSEASELIASLVATMPNPVLKSQLEFAFKHVAEKGARSNTNTKQNNNSMSNPNNNNKGSISANAGVIHHTQEMKIQVSDPFADSLRTLLRCAISRLPRLPVVSAEHVRAISLGVSNLDAHQAQSLSSFIEILGVKCGVSASLLEPIESLRPAHARLCKNLNGLQSWVTMGIASVSKLPANTLVLLFEFATACYTRIGEARLDEDFPTLPSNTVAKGVMASGFYGGGSRAANASNKKNKQLNALIPTSTNEDFPSLPSSNPQALPTTTSGNSRFKAPKFGSGKATISLAELDRMLNKKSLDEETKDSAWSIGGGISTVAPSSLPQDPLMNYNVGVTKNKGKKFARHDTNQNDYNDKITNAPTTSTAPLKAGVTTGAWGASASSVGTISSLQKKMDAIAIEDTFNVVNFKNNAGNSKPKKTPGLDSSNKPVKLAAGVTPLWGSLNAPEAVNSNVFIDKKNNNKGKNNNTKTTVDEPMPPGLSQFFDKNAQENDEAIAYALQMEEANKSAAKGTYGGLKLSMGRSFWGAEGVKNKVDTRTKDVNEFLTNVKNLSHNSEIKNAKNINNNTKNKKK